MYLTAPGGGLCRAYLLGFYQLTVLITRITSEHQSQLVGSIGYADSHPWRVIYGVKESH